MRRWARGMPGAVLLAWAVFHSGCGSEEAAGSLAGWAPLPMHKARHFQLWERDAQRMLITFGPGGNTDTAGMFILGPPGPGPAGAVYLGPALDRVALVSTTHASFFSILGRADAVVGCAYADRLRDTAVARLAAAGKLAEIAGPEGTDRERVLLLAPDALLTYPYGTGWSMPLRTGPPQVPIAEYLEPHPLGRAEWVRAFGLLLGEEQAADSIYQRIVQRYEAVQAELAIDSARPPVFFGSAWKGSWSVPAGNSYMAHLIADAGGHYLFAGHDAQGNIDIDLEQVLETGRKARYWGRILEQRGGVAAADVADHDDRILALPAFRDQGGFYANSMESDLFGQAGLEPDVVLRDLMAIFHPRHFPGHNAVYFRPVRAAGDQAR